MRYLQLTFPKCGSQWVRDVLTSVDVLKECGVRVPNRVGCTLHVNSSWPQQEQNTFFGPVYNASLEDWLEHSDIDDRAVVVLRDPRDLVVSLMHSIALSHDNADQVLLFREPLLTLDPKNRLLLAMGVFRTLQWAFYSWSAKSPPSSVYVTSYERILQDQQREFSEIIRFFEWSVPGEVITKVVRLFSFEERSGRIPGVEEPHSHYRKGISGDWRNHFDRSTGVLFESSYPGLLEQLGYEKDSSWHKGLPESIRPSTSDDGIETLKRFHEAKAQITKQSEELLALKKACDERNDLIMELTSACEDRLKVIEELRDVCSRRLDLIQSLEEECRKRDEVIQQLTSPMGAGKK